MESYPDNIDVPRSFHTTTPAVAAAFHRVTESPSTTLAFERPSTRCNGVIVEDVESWSTAATSKAVDSVAPVGGGTPLVVNSDVTDPQFRHRRPQHKSASLEKLSLHSAKLAINSPYLSPVSPNDVAFQDPTSLSTKSPTMMLTPSPNGAVVSTSASTIVTTSTISSSLTNTPSTPSSGVAAALLLLHTPPIAGGVNGEIPNGSLPVDVRPPERSLREGVIKKLESPLTTGRSSSSDTESAPTVSQTPSTSTTSAPDYTIISPHKLALRKHLEEEEERQRCLSVQTERQPERELETYEKHPSSKAIGEEIAESPTVNDSIFTNSRGNNDAAGCDAWITASSNRRRIVREPPPTEKKSVHLPAKLIHKTTNHSSQQKMIITSTVDNVANLKEANSNADFSRTLTLGDQMQRIIESEYKLQDQKDKESLLLQPQQPGKKSRKRSGKQASSSPSTSPLRNSLDRRNQLSLNLSTQDRGTARGVSQTMTTSLTMTTTSSISAVSSGFDPKLYIPVDGRNLIVNGVVDHGERSYDNISALSSRCSSSSASFFSSSHPPYQSTARSTTLTGAISNPSSQLSALPSNYLRVSTPTSSIITSSSSWNTVSRSILPLSSTAAFAPSSSPFLASTSHINSNHIQVASSPSQKPRSSSHLVNSGDLHSAILAAPASMAPHRKLQVRNGARTTASSFLTSSSLTSSSSSSVSAATLKHSPKLFNGSSTPSPPHLMAGTNSKLWAPLTPPPSIRPVGVPLTSFITAPHGTAACYVAPLPSVVVASPAVNNQLTAIRSKEDERRAIGANPQHAVIAPPP